MKIAYISNSIIPSRTANSIHVMKMCQAFADNGHEVVLFAPKHINNDYSIDVFNYYGVKNNFEIKYIEYINIPKLWLFSYALNVCRVIMSKSFDFIYGRDLKSCFFSSLSTKNYYVSYESHKPYDKYNFIDKILLKLMFRQKVFKHLVVISNALKEIYINDKVLDSNKIFVAHDGADEPKDKKTILQIVESNKLRVGYTGHLYQGRGIDIILQVAKELPGIEFHIVGGNDKDINFWKQQLGIIDNVVYHGFVDPAKVYQYVNSFDILLAPYQNVVSLSGGKGNTSQYMSPLKVFEYMASQKPIIISDLPVLHEVLDNDEAYFVTYNNIKEWVNAIIYLSNKETRDNFAMKSFNNFIKNYSWRSRAEQIVNIVSDV